MTAVFWYEISELQVFQWNQYSYTQFRFKSFTFSITLPSENILFHPSDMHIDCARYCCGRTLQTHTILIHALSICATCSPVKHASENKIFSTVIYSSVNKSFSTSSLRWNSSFPCNDIEKSHETTNRAHDYCSFYLIWKRNQNISFSWLWFDGWILDSYTFLAFKMKPFINCHSFLSHKQCNASNDRWR